MQSRFKMALSVFIFVLISLPFFGLFHIAMRNNTVVTPPWLFARLDMVLSRQLISDEGQFSIEVPRGWRVNIRTPNATLGGRAQQYIHVSDEIRAGRRRPRTIMNADMSVTIAVLSLNNARTVQELGEELYVQHSARVGTRWQSPRFEMRMLRVGYQWAKNTIFLGGRTSVYWQTIDSSLNHYTVTFNTENRAYYEPIFENIMRSFSIYR